MINVSKIIWVFSIFFFFFGKLLFGEPIYYAHYKNIIDDTLIEKGYALTFKFQSSKNKIISNSKLVEIKKYENNRIIFKRVYWNRKYYYDYYFLYNMKHILIAEVVITSDGLLSDSINYEYNSGKIHRAESFTKDRINTVEYEFDSQSNLVREILFKWNFKYSEKNYAVIETPGYRKTFDIFKDTNTNFRADTLNILLLDKISNTLVNVSEEESQVFYAVEKYDKDQRLKSSMIVNQENGGEIGCSFKEIKNFPVYNIDNSLIKEVIYFYCSEMKVRSYSERTLYFNVIPFKLKYPIETLN